jgi:hypothetical protein
MPSMIYAVVLCFSNPGCSSPDPGSKTYQSAQECIDAMTHEHNGHLIGNRLYLDATNDMWVECYEKSGSSKWKPRPERSCAPGLSELCP